ncbi:transposable element Tcb1 transposase [Trichonephila clavipes]|nr:transposable element Tcb1 transposase [Trichonephila clavipes]
MTAQWYVHDILQPHVLPFVQRLPKAIFQQDNAWPHTGRVSQDCLRTVTTLPRFVSNRVYLGSFGRRVGHQTSLNELEARNLQQIWNEMSQDIKQSLCASMPDCITSCIRTTGGSTGY